MGFLRKKTTIWISPLDMHLPSYNTKILLLRLESWFSKHSYGVSTLSTKSSTFLHPLIFPLFLFPFCLPLFTLISFTFWPINTITFSHVVLLTVYVHWYSPHSFKPSKSRKEPLSPLSITIPHHIDIHIHIYPSEIRLSILMFSSILPQNKGNDPSINNNTQNHSQDRQDPSTEPPIFIRQLPPYYPQKLHEYNILLARNIQNIIYKTILHE